MAQQGWVAIHRKITETDLWQDDEPYCKRAAWIDLILMANHEGRDVWVGVKTIRVERGSFITSQEKLAARWKWSRKKVKTFLDSLQSLGMIKTSVSTGKYTAVTLENYGFYQDTRAGEAQVMEQEKNGRRTEEEQERNGNGSTSGTQTTMINNYNNDKQYAAAYAREQTSNLNEVNVQPLPVGVPFSAGECTLPQEMPIPGGEGNADIAGAMKLYEANISPLTPIIAQQLSVLLDEVGYACFARAVEKACRNGARRYRYIEAVAKGLAAGRDFDEPRSGGTWDSAFSQYLGGRENDQDNQKRYSGDDTAAAPEWQAYAAGNGS